MDSQKLWVAKATSQQKPRKFPKARRITESPAESPAKARGSSSDFPNHSQNGEKCPYKAQKPADGETVERVAFRGVRAKSRFFGGEMPGKAPEHRRPGGLPDVRGLVTAAGALTAGNPAATLQVKPLRNASGKGGAAAPPPDTMHAPERRATPRGCSVGVRRFWCV